MPQKIIFEFLGAPAENDEHARSLAGWLGESEDLYGAAELRMVRPAADELGPLADAAVIVASGGSVAVSFLTWLGERARGRRIDLTVTRADGARLEIAAGDPGRLSTIEDQVTRFLEEEDG